MRQTSLSVSLSIMAAQVWPPAEKQVPRASRRALSERAQPDPDESPRPQAPAPDLGANIADREIMGDRAGHVKRFVL
jgi:hypothetical protein